jgi:hypothetical protein
MYPKKLVYMYAPTTRLLKCQLHLLTDDENARVLEEGFMETEGDGLIVAHYDGLIRPSEIRIQSIGNVD